MRSQRVIATVLTMVAVTAAYGVDYYVDANSGNDAWDGTTAIIPDQATIEAGGTIAGPRKTLHAMMSDSRVAAGDTVWAAEGDYNEGGDVYGSQVTSNRVQVKAGVMLCATGARDATFISGANGIEGAYSNGAVRCVYFLSPPEGAAYGCGIVKGFTVRNGRTCSATEYGGASLGSGLLVECDFKGNGCFDTNRGGTMSGGTALRCRFSSRNQAYWGYSGTRIIDSLIAAASGFYWKCYAYNCTFSGNGYVRYGHTYNCLFIGTGAGTSSQAASGTGNITIHNYAFSRSDFHETACTTNETCRVVTAAETPYNETTLRPLPGSVAIDGGDVSLYLAATNGWKAAWCAEFGKDYYGGDRVVNGQIDVGCGERQSGSALMITDASDGLVVEGAEKGVSSIAEGATAEITFSRTLTSDRLCLGVEVDGVFHSFGGTTSDVPYAVVLPYSSEHDYFVSAVYETNQKDWYVSPDGNNANKGYHRNCPCKTLDKAMELTTENADNVIHAAAGVYDSFAEGEAYESARSRVTVKEGVGLVADDWPLQETVIQGALDTTADADAYGNGPHAVRCVTVNRSGYVRGFKLTGGRTNKRVNSDSSEAVQGGAAYLYPIAALVDCELTGNGCSYRGRAVAAPNSSGVLIRCYVHDQVANANYDIFYRVNVIDSYIKGQGSSDHTYYGRGFVLNSTVVNGDVRASGDLRVLNTYLEKVSVASSAVVVCTNCVFTSSATSAMASETCSYDPATCRFSVSSNNAIDENIRPKTKASPLVDAGDKTIYEAVFPAGWSQFKEADFACGQRIYNGQIDVGCGEYDFRGDFAGMLGKRAVISEMGPNVTTNAVPNVVVPAGESITLSMAPRASGRETRYELVYTPEGGSQAVISESSAEAFSRTLDGACTIQSLDGYVGFLFQVR